MCFLFHDWSKWEQYREQGFVTFGWGKQAGQTAQYSETRQKRVCNSCGKQQDELVKKG